MRAKPKRPYRNLEDFRRRHILGVDTGGWPCVRCLGLGREYDPHDPPCPVEGNKYRRTIPCIACKGSCQSTKAAVTEAYRKTIEAWRAAKEDYDSLVQIRQEALQRLTKDEIKALRELGV